MFLFSIIVFFVINVFKTPKVCFSLMQLKRIVVISGQSICHWSKLILTTSGPLTSLLHHHQALFTNTNKLLEQLGNIILCCAPHTN